MISRYRFFGIATFISLFMLMMTGACSSGDKYEAMRKSLSEYMEGKDARIGVAVIVDGQDTISIDGNREFPMLSVYKFPIALALADHYRQNNLPSDFPVTVLPEDLHLDTYSPMTEKILSSGTVHRDTLEIPTIELLGYMLQQSDNNASDIALREVGGAGNVERYLERSGIGGVHVRSSEAEMHIDNMLCYENSSTPIAMAALIDKFDRECNDPISIEIKRLMENCETGLERLAKPLGEAVIGHKTGTGFTLPGGRLMAVNDVGYVHLPEGRRYAIAVFVEDSGYDMSRTESLISGISEIVRSYLENCSDN